MAGVWETAAFALRAAGAKDVRQDVFGIVHQVLLALSPLWVNAYVYMVLGRMVYFFIPEKKCFGITAQRLTLIFVVLDVFAFLVQGSSTTLMNSDDPKMVKIGINICKRHAHTHFSISKSKKHITNQPLQPDMGGIGLQELFILIFTGLAIRFQKRMRLVEITNPPPTPWRPLLYTVYAGLILITIRIIYRLVEYSSGFDSPIATNEPALLALDPTPMSIAILLFGIFHPGRFLVGPDSEFPKKEKKKKRGKGWWFGRKGGDDGWVEVERQDPEVVPLQRRGDSGEGRELEDVSLEQRLGYQVGQLAGSPPRERYHPVGNP